MPEMTTHRGPISGRARTCDGRPLADITTALRGPSILRGLFAEFASGIPDETRYVGVQADLRIPTAPRMWQRGLLYGASADAVPWHAEC